MPESYPFQPELRVFPHDPDDKSYAGDLVGYADLAPRLNSLMASSDRVSAQVVGTSTLGRDLYLVTLTAPEDESETAQQKEWRELIQHEPVAAALDTELAADYKTPIWFSANIHGNEWEGTDASLEYLEELATSDSPEVADLLEEHRFYFSLTLNPDGRVAGTRATALGFDHNRDQITNTLPESHSYVSTVQQLLPIYTADLHGYTGNLQVEPTGPPHGENYEYDLFIPHNYALALQVEEDVVAADIPGNPLTEAGGIKIPYRDTPSGWDDYPPIFTGQYSAFYGALTATVELPLGRTGGVMTPERAAINVAVGRQVIESTVDYISTNSDEILANQIEFFRRGVAGEPKVSLTVDNIAGVVGPDQWKPLWDVADNQDEVTLPRAYVIPFGEAQRSASDMSALVEQLIFHDIEVGVLTAPQSVDGTTYPAGSYVIDMHQPKKGLANSLLDLGTDISAKVPSMYDISAWSYSYLWGATVDKVGSVQDAPIQGVQLIDAPLSQASAPTEVQHLTFEVAGIEDYRALNDLLDQDATTWLLPTGQAVVAPDDHAKAVNAAVEHDIAFRAASPAEVAAVTSGDAKELDEVQVAYVGRQDERTSLQELGFDPVALTASSISEDPSVLDGVDVLWVGSSLEFGDDQETGREAVQAWLAEGNALVGFGGGALAAASDFGLVSATGVAGNRRGNGIVAVDTPADSLLAPHAQDFAFIYPALSFTDLGAGTTVEQTYAEGNPLLAGHWRGSDETNGPEYAAGKASVISGESATGGKAVVFGTSGFFRNHPKGGISQAGQAIFWAAPAAQVTRIAGANRYATSAAIAAQFGDVDTVYLASGQKFPDALTGTAPAVRDGAPVVLTRPGNLSTPAAAALDLLQPGHVFVIGGTDAVSDAVLAQTRELTGANVVRVFGSDRYGTASQLALARFSAADVDTVYIADGLTFADSLAGGPLAGIGDDPILLTRSSKLPQASVDALVALDPEHVVVLGGEARISDDVLFELKSHVDSVERVAGKDRYETAAFIADRIPESQAVFVASGQAFPDALSGAAWAGSLESPLLLTRAASLPPSTAGTLVERSPERVTLFGGTTAITDAVRTSIEELFLP